MVVSGGQVVVTGQVVVHQVSGGFDQGDFWLLELPGAGCR